MQHENFEVIQIAIYSTTTIAGFIFFIFILLIKLKKRQIYIENNILEFRHNLEKNILSAQLEIQEETLNRISKDIHDNISLSLTLSKLYLNNLKINEDGSNNQSTITSCIDLISKSLIDLSDLSKSIDGEIVKKYGIIEAVTREVNYVNKLGNPDAKIEIIGETKFLNWKVELMIFRIIQESIRNAIRHSKCKSIFIWLDYGETSLSVMIRDDGIGFETKEREKNKHLSSGLNNMKDRAKLINANFNLISKIDEGTEIHINTPYQYE
jgi:signal transduction histidine kinase